MEAVALLAGVQARTLECDLFVFIICFSIFLNWLQKNNKAFVFFFMFIDMVFL